MYYTMLLRSGIHRTKSWLKVVICTGIYCTASTVVTADVQPRADFDSLVHAIHAQVAPEVSYSGLEDHLWTLYQSPLILRRPTRPDLKSLYMLTEKQISHLLQYIALHGPLISVYELSAVPGFDESTIRQMLPFVRVDGSCPTHTNYGGDLGYSLVRYGRILETAKGYLPNKNNQTPYQGSPNYLLGRLNIKHPKGWGLGYVAGKSPGETLLDTASFHGIVQRQRFYWTWTGEKILQKLIIGDYELGYGEGLLLDAGFSLKQGDVTQATKGNNRGIRPHSSLTNIAFRGAAATWNWHDFGLTAYCSNAALHGKVYSDEENPSNQYLQSITRGGSFRTESELAKKGKVREKVVGATIFYESMPSGIEVGINGLYTTYSLPIFPDLKYGNPQRFSGKENFNSSLFYRYRWKNLHFFGEKGYAKSGGRGTVAGMQASWTRYLDTVTLWREYTQNFHAFYGNAFKEGSGLNINEEGLYIGGKVYPWNSLHIESYYDFFSFPWFEGKPAQGYSWRSKATYQPTKTAHMTLQYKTKKKARKIPKLSQTAMSFKSNLKLKARYQWSKKTALQTIAQYSQDHFLNEDNRGYAIVQDLFYKVQKWQLKGRLAWFDSTRQETALYFYEPNFLHYGFNFKPYQGQGEQFCILAVYKPIAAIRFEVKYIAVHYRGKKSIGNGYQAIAGNLKNEFSAQLILKY